MSQTPDMWYVRSRGQVQGPYSIPQLRQLLERGRFSRQHEVSDDGASWRRATDIPDLFSSRVQKKVRAVPASVEILPAEEVVLELPDSVLPSVVGATETRWMYVYNEKRCGPVPESELHTLLSQGTVPVDSLIWTEGWPDWVAACDVPTFRSATTAKPAKSPSSQSSSDTVGTLQEARTGAATSSLILGIIGLTLLLIAALAAGLRIALSKDLSNIESVVVLGIVRWACGILALPPSILAIVLGHIARNATSTAGGLVPGGTQARIGLILGYVTLSPLILGGIAALALVLVAG